MLFYVVIYDIPCDKRRKNYPLSRHTLSPYSLGKLSEWKLVTINPSGND